MARDGIDLSELMDFADRLDGSGQSMEKRERKFLQQQGNKLRRKTKAQARLSGIKQHTGNYMKGIKRGKVWKKSDGAQAVRVYSNAPHAHLVEDGHDQKVNPGKGEGNGRGVKPGKGIGRTVGHIEGRKVFLKAYEAFAPEYENDAEEMVDEMIRKI